MHAPWARIHAPRRTLSHAAYSFFSPSKVEEFAAKLEEARESIRAEYKEQLDRHKKDAAAQQAELRRALEAQLVTTFLGARMCAAMRAREVVLRARVLEADEANAGYRVRTLWEQRLQLDATGVAGAVKPKEQ